MLTFLVLVICHFVCDFGLQIGGIGEKKYGLNKYMLWHAVIVSLGFLIPALMIFDFSKVLVATGFIFLTHLVVDISKAYIYKKKRIGTDDNRFWTLLGVDQILHVVAIYIGLIFLGGR